MKVSRKELKTRRMQSTGYIVGAVILILILALNLYELIAQGVDISDARLSDWIIFTLYPLLIPLLLWRWKKEERKLQTLEVDETKS